MQQCQTKIGIFNAKVTLQGLAGITGFGGHFIIQGVPSGEHVVKIEAEGYEPVYRFATLQNDRAHEELQMVQLHPKNENVTLIGSQGGTHYANNGAFIVIPEGALKEETAIGFTSIGSISSLPEVREGEVFIGGAKLHPTGIVFDKPATLYVPLSKEFENMQDGQVLFASYFNEVTKKWQEDGSLGIVTYLNGKAFIRYKINHFTWLIWFLKTYLGYGKGSIQGCVQWSNGDPAKYIQIHSEWGIGNEVITNGNGIFTELFRHSVPLNRYYSLWRPPTWSKKQGRYLFTPYEAWKKYDEIVVPYTGGDTKAERCMIIPEEDREIAPIFSFDVTYEQEDTYCEAVVDPGLVAVPNPYPIPDPVIKPCDLDNPYCNPDLPSPTQIQRSDTLQGLQQKISEDNISVKLSEEIVVFGDDIHSIDIKIPTFGMIDAIKLSTLNVELNENDIAGEMEVVYPTNDSWYFDPVTGTYVVMSSGTASTGWLSPNVFHLSYQPTSKLEANLDQKIDFQIAYSHIGSAHSDSSPEQTIDVDVDIDVIDSISIPPVRFLELDNKHILTAFDPFEEEAIWWRKQGQDNSQDVFDFPLMILSDGYLNIVYRESEKSKLKGATFHLPIFALDENKNILSADFSSLKLKNDDWKGVSTPVTIAMKDGLALLPVTIEVDDPATIDMSMQLPAIEIYSEAASNASGLQTQAVPIVVYVVGVEVATFIATKPEVARQVALRAATIGSAVVVCVQSECLKATQDAITSFNSAVNNLMNSTITSTSATLPSVDSLYQNASSGHVCTVGEVPVNWSGIPSIAPRYPYPEIDDSAIKAWLQANGRIMEDTGTELKTVIVSPNTPCGRGGNNIPEPDYASYEQLSEYERGRRRERASFLAWFVEAKHVAQTGKGFFRPWNSDAVELLSCVGSTRPRNSRFDTRLDEISNWRSCDFAGQIKFLMDYCFDPRNPDSISPDNSYHPSKNNGQSMSYTHNVHHRNSVRRNPTLIDNLKNLIIVDSETHKLTCHEDDYNNMTAGDLLEESAIELLTSTIGEIPDFSHCR